MNESTSSKNEEVDDADDDDDDDVHDLCNGGAEETDLIEISLAALEPIDLNTTNATH